MQEIIKEVRGTRQGNYSKLQNTVGPSDIAPWEA